MTAKRIELPRSERRYVFALTPLADAMFQLLIFFMLSSSLTPYSLLTLRNGPGTQTAAATTETPTPAPAVDQQPVSSWTIEEGAIIAGGQRFNFDALPGLASVLSQREDPRVLLISSPRAQVQDIVTVLETLAAAQITSVQLVSLVTQ